MMKVKIICLLLALTMVMGTGVLYAQMLHIEGSTTVGPIADDFTNSFA